MWDSKVCRIIIICTLSVLGAVILAYEYGVAASYNRFYPGTIINGINMSCRTIEDAENALYENPSEYTLIIKFRDREERLNGYDIGMDISYEGDLSQLMADMNPLKWYETFFMNSYDIKKTVTLDDEKLKKKMDEFYGLRSSNMKNPQNPTIKIDDNGKVYAEDGDPGSLIENVSEVYELAKQSVINEEAEIDLDALGFYKEPQYTSKSEEVKRCVDTCNRYAGLKIGYQYADATIYYEPSEIFNVLRISKNYNVSVSRSSVQSLLASFARKHDTYSKIRDFKTHNRKNIKVVYSEYGWEIDQEAELDLLYTDIVTFNSEVRPPEFTHSGFTYDKNCNDIGDTYAEVDLINQEMYYYKNGKLVVTTDVVTGNVRRGLSTPPGIYYVYYKQSPATLTGGEEPVDVRYWMPFNRGIGFHDANWRWKFGEEIYQNNGSHGCVNMPSKAAAQLFREIEPGTPVIVY